ncbi:MAG: prepilin-type N-terminal cleavage/methylation domain-containing protein [Planctomycetes bacterium]|nr:prepilin-type N-terminal cleavage/methylation domain-containing protein [Planctomycetota bacterium]
MDAAAKRQSPIPNPQSLIPNPSRPAFTLIELLTVISIMLILVTLTATMMRPDVEGRRVREAARSINVYLASARNRAMETGRPCGVIFRNFGAPGFAMNADQCEVPPSYCGETEFSTATVSVAANNSYIAARLYSDYGSTLEPLPIGMVRPGDLIQFNCQGPVYQIHGISTDPPPNNPQNTVVNGFVTGSTIFASVADVGQNPLVPWPESPFWSSTVPYRIFRAPIKGFAQPLQLPAATVVDLSASGVDTTFVNAADFTVLFSPNGAVECVYHGAIRYNLTGTIYLLVGSRERVENGYTPDNPNEDTLTNYQYQNNRWVTINPQTGAVQSEPVAAIPLGTTDIPTAIIRARDLAGEALGMGGK